MESKLHSLLVLPERPSVGKLILYLQNEVIVLAGVLHPLDISLEEAKEMGLTAETVAATYPRGYVAGLVGSAIWDLVPSDARPLGCSFAYYDGSTIILYGTFSEADLMGPIHPDLVYECLDMRMPIAYGHPTLLGFLHDAPPPITEYIKMPARAGT